MRVKLNIEWEATADADETNEDEKQASEVIRQSVADYVDDLRRRCEEAGLRVRVVQE